MDRQDVVDPVTGTTETEALTALLGSEGLTEDRLDDLRRAAVQVKETQLTIALHHKLVIHGLYAELGTWQAVGDAMGVPKNTAWNWAHAGPADAAYAAPPASAR